MTTETETDSGGRYRETETERSAEMGEKNRLYVCRQK